MAERRTREGTATSEFGVSKRENHDSTSFYERFPAPSYGFFCDHQPTMPSEPTSHKVRSWERLEVLRARAEAGEELWHPDDEKQRCDWPERLAMKNEVNRLFGLSRGLTN